jgi:hypothetical protein
VKPPLSARQKPSKPHNLHGKKGSQEQKKAGKPAQRRAKGQGKRAARPQSKKMRLANLRFNFASISGVRKGLSRACSLYVKGKVAERKIRTLTYVLSRVASMVRDSELEDYLQRLEKLEHEVRGEGLKLCNTH